MFAAEDAPTLFCSSMEDSANECGALVTTLTVAVTDALVGRATATPAQGSLPAGRLRAPANYVLDEAANVVRWRQLPNRYSHFGSRGITAEPVYRRYGPVDGRTSIPQGRSK